MKDITKQFIKRALKDNKVSELTTEKVMKELSKYAVYLEKYFHTMTASDWYDMILDDLVKNEYLIEEEN